MRKSIFLAVAIVLVVALAAPPAFGQRGRGGGRGGGGGGVDEATVLEEFDSLVELIWNDAEEDAWDDLNDDEGKQAFITSFWEVRDPTPGTVDNEFRDVWMQRAAYAARAFGREGSNGWATDRGKFYMIYGPEVLLEQETREVSGSGAAGFGAVQQGAGTGQNIIWTLDPSQNEYLDGKTSVTFARYQRSYSKLTGGIDYHQEAFLAGVAVNTYFEARRANPASAGPAARPITDIALDAADAAGAPPAPPTADVLAMQELMQTGAMRQDLMLTQAMAYIPASEGNSFAMFNFEIGKDGLTFDNAPASMLAFGVLLQRDPAAAGGEQFMRDVKSTFAVSPDEGDADTSATHSFGMTLPPGDYRLAWGVMDNTSENIATTSYEFTVPDYRSEGLEIPSVLVASGLEQQADAIDVNTVYSGTRVGNLALNTNLDNDFGRNDSLRLLYFVKGLAVDEATLQPTFEVGHRILVAGTEESIARLQMVRLNVGAVEQEIPLAQVAQLEAGGAYEIEIHITDQVSGAELIKRVPFTVRGSQAP